jgi:hypothetical protein
MPKIPRRGRTGGVEAPDPDGEKAGIVAQGKGRLYTLAPGVLAEGGGRVVRLGICKLRFG